MTGLLDEVMREKAGAVGAPQLDLDRIVGDGDRRVRRGRSTTAAAAVAVVAVAAGGSWLVTGSDDADGPRIASTGSPTAEISYAKGNQIHVGDDVVASTEPVWSYVLTDDGPVWTARSGGVYVLQDGEQVQIGQVRHGHSLRADGSIVAWSEGAEGDVPELVVYDTSTHEVVLRSTDSADAGEISADGSTPSEEVHVEAVDGDAVYWRSGHGIVRHDLGSGDTELMSSTGAYLIADVAAGLIAYEHGTETSSPQREGVFVGRELGAGASTGHHGSAYLSTEGSHVSFEDADQMFVVHTATGEDVTPEVKGYPFHVVSQWLDDDTAVVFGFRGDDDEAVEVDFLRCEVPAGECAVEASDTVTYGDFQLPVGEHIGD